MATETTTSEITEIANGLRNAEIAYAARFNESTRKPRAPHIDQVAGCTLRAYDGRIVAQLTVYGRTYRGRKFSRTVGAVVRDDAVEAVEALVALVKLVTA